MKYKFLDQRIDYDGSQLRSLFAYMSHEILGDSVIAFRGACDIPFENMADGEDVLAKSAIRGGDMLHFIMEEFGASLQLAVNRQRLFAAIVLEELRKFCPQRKMWRSGDDLYVDDGKLSISIATVSPVSALIHFAMNITNENTPVKTTSLQDLGIDPRSFADKVADRFLEEVRTMKEACCKVFPR